MRARDRNRDLVLVNANIERTRRTRNGFSCLRGNCWMGDSQHRTITEKEFMSTPTCKWKDLVINKIISEFPRWTAGRQMSWTTYWRVLYCNRRRAERPCLYCHRLIDEKGRIQTEEMYLLLRSVWHQRLLSQKARRFRGANPNEIRSNIGHKLRKSCLRHS